MNDLFDKPSFYDTFKMYYEMSKAFNNRPSQRHKYRNNDKQKLTAFNHRVAKRRKHNKESRKARKRARR